MIEFTLSEISKKLIRDFSVSLTHLGKLAEVPLEDVLITIRNLVQAETPVGKTERLKREWSSVSQVAGGFSFENRVPYAYVIEEGRYRGEGPRTVRSADGIYSRQAPEGMTSPVLTNEVLINQSIKFILNQITEILEK